jgi:hypothetical protein
LSEEKVRLLREIAQLKAGGKVLGTSEDPAGGYYYTSPSTTSPTQTNQPGSGFGVPANLVPKVSTNSTISSIGALRLYEFVLGIFFIAAMMNWIIV